MTMVLIAMKGSVCLWKIRPYPRYDEVGDGVAAVSVTGSTFSVPGRTNEGLDLRNNHSECSTSSGGI